MRRGMRRGGIAIVEALIGLSILTVSLGSLFMLVSNAFQVSEANTEQIIAAYLAQEGMELTKYMVEANYETGQPTWRTNITRQSPPEDRTICFQPDYRINHEATPLFTLAAPTRVSSGRGCTANPSSNSFFDPARVEIVYQPLYYHEAGLRPGYTYESAGGVPTKFRRMVVISARTTINNIQQARDCSPRVPPNGAAPCVMQVVSAVTWVTDRGERRYVVLEETFFDWVVPQCQDRRDNDLDGTVDYNGGVDVTGDGIPDGPDPNCGGNFRDNSESR